MNKQGRRYNREKWGWNDKGLIPNNDDLIKGFNCLNKTDKDNKISIKDFLQTLMNGVSSAIGGINDFKIGYNYLSKTAKDCGFKIIN